MTGAHVEIGTMVAGFVLTLRAAFLALRAAKSRSPSSLLMKLRTPPVSWTGGGSADPQTMAMHQAVLAGAEAEAINADLVRAGKLSRKSAWWAIGAAILTVVGAIVARLLG